MKFSLPKLDEIEIFLLFSLFKKVGTLFLHARCMEVTFSLHATCIDANALFPTTRCADDAFSLHGKCASAISRGKNGALRPLLKVDEVDVYPYHLGEV